MHRTVHAHPRFPNETARRLDRLRRGSHHPLARFINAVLADSLDAGFAPRVLRATHARLERGPHERI